MKALRFTFYGYWLSAIIGYSLQAYNGGGYTFLLLSILLLAVNLVQSITSLYKLRKLEVLIFFIIDFLLIAYLLYQNAEANKFVV